MGDCTIWGDMSGGKKKGVINRMLVLEFDRLKLKRGIT